MATAAPKPIDPRLYQDLVEQTRDYAVFILDPQGNIKTWNLGAQRLKGYAPDEIIGRHFSVFYTADAIASDWPAHELRVATAEGRFEDEGWRLRKDGSRFWANVIITALRDEQGKLLGFAKITRDLTDRRMHEEALRQSEERFRLLVEGVQDYAIFMLDPQGVVTSWNAGAQNIKGYSREEIIGKHFSCFYGADDVQAGKPWQELALARRMGRVQDEGWRIRKNGERFWARAVISAVYDQDERLRGFAKVTQDLSERRHLEGLQKTAKNLNEFIATLAHELRNPLAPIRNAIQLMARTPPGDPAQAAMRETIERQSAQLARIVDDMIDIARITRGEMHMEHEAVDLAQVVQRAAETAAPAIGAARHTLEIDVPLGSLLVRGDVHRLSQLVGNLLSNAARYTPAGGSISVKGLARQGQAVLYVRDTGRGIRPDMLQRIFGMFVQERAPVERVGGGLGVGLALARRIAELHDGELQAQSEGEGKGSEFTLTIPLSRVPAETARETAEPAPPGTARRILVVDDNVDAANTLGLLLKSLGHETAVVHDGAQALELFETFRPDVVLLDIGLPGMDGYEVARCLQAAKGDRALRIIAVTGWGQDADRRRSSEVGFDQHLVKPVDIELLQRVLRNGATLH